jgi:hypothetical protein
VSEGELEQLIKEQAEHDGNYAVAYALLRVASQLKWLGTGDAATTMGALEFVGTMIKEAATTISTDVARSIAETATAISEVATAISESSPP